MAGTYLKDQFEEFVRDCYTVDGPPDGEQLAQLRAAWYLGALAAKAPQAPETLPEIIDWVTGVQLEATVGAKETDADGEKP